MGTVLEMQLRPDVPLLEGIELYTQILGKHPGLCSMSRSCDWVVYNSALNISRVSSEVRSWCSVILMFLVTISMEIKYVFCCFFFSKPLTLEDKAGFGYKYIHALDEEDFDLLSHFDDCVEFIDDGRKAGGVFVHWYGPTLHSICQNNCCLEFICFMDVSIVLFATDYQV